MERIDGQEPIDGEKEDDPWAGHPAGLWGDDSEGEPRSADGEQRATTASEAGEPEVFEAEAESESTAGPVWNERDNEESASESDRDTYAREPGYERGDVSEERSDRWQPDTYDDQPAQRAAIEADRPRPSARTGSWLASDEASDADDEEDEVYSGPIARRSPWQPADSFEDRKPWEHGADGEAEGGDEGRRRRTLQPGHMAPQRAARVAEEEPAVVTPLHIEKGESRHRYRTIIREVVETGLLAILVFLSVRASFQNFKVDGASMQPTLENGQFLIVNKLIYSEIDLEKLGTYFPFIDGGDSPKRNVFHGPERGDIVVLQDPRSPKTDLIKRIIGLPGETLEIVDGKVFVNDFLLEEPYITSEWTDTRPKIAIPEDYYFVMGDNRENSLDSRSQQVGLIHKDLIIGKAMFSYWPKSKFGLTPNGSGKVTEEERPIVTARRIEEFVPAD